MDAQQFLVEFGHIANAPGGVARLRELVLHLAVTGKLAQQNSTDEHAEKVLERMRLTASQVGSKKRGGQKKKLNEQQAFNSHFLPNGWALAELGELGDWGAGSTPSRSNPSYYGGDIPWFKSGELKADYITKSEEFVSELALQECSLRLNVPGDVLIAMYGANIGQTAITGVKSTTNQAVCACTPYSGLINRFLLLLLRALQNYFISLGAGGAQPNISKEKIVATTVGLPPTEEQSRIVAKVEELMALCDKLETQQQDRRKLQNKLRQSTLQAIAAATSPHELQTTWTRLADNFAQLFHATEDVKALRDVIFDLAMRGLLLPTATINTVGLDEELPPLPTGWSWKTLGELSEYITSGSRGWKGYIATSGDAFIRSQDIKQDALIFENPAFVSLPEKAEGKRTLVREGDLLLTITGGNVGRCASVPTLNFKAYVSQHVALIRLHDYTLAEFIHFWMINAQGGRNFLSRYIYGDKPGLNLAQVASVPVPIPLTSERTKILESLRQYQVMCDRLAKQVDSRRKLAETFAKTAVASITGIATEQDEEPMKAPQTELIAPLHLGKTPDIKAQAPLATILVRHNGEMLAKDLWQRFGGEIDAFYAQLKTEVAHGWIVEPAVAEMREKRAESADA